jgi:hypothetical protein
METKFEPLKIRIEFQLPDRASRDALETKITNFIAGQDPGSYAQNLYREDPQDSSNPFWFRTNMTIIVDEIADVSAIRSTILANIDTFGTVINYEFDFEEIKAPDAIE